jgi:hypothetical protein
MDKLLAPDALKPLSCFDSLNHFHGNIRHFSILYGRFGFVSGHDFSRAVKDEKTIGLQPLRARNPSKMPRPERILGLKKPAAKAQIFVGPLRPD